MRFQRGKVGRSRDFNGLQRTFTSDVHLSEGHAVPPLIFLNGEDNPGRMEIQVSQEWKYFNNE